LISNHCPGKIVVFFRDNAYFGGKWAVLCCSPGKFGLFFRDDVRIAAQSRQSRLLAELRRLLN
jgi:hypothetical protein